MSPRKARSTPPDVTIGSKPRYSIRETAALLGISEIMIYRRMREGALRTVRDGRRTFITDEEITQYAARSRA